MCLISQRAANLPTLLCSFVISALVLLPLFAFLILVMKRRRPRPGQTTDIDDLESSRKVAHIVDAPFSSEKARPSEPPLRKRKKSKAIPRRMEHMKKHVRPSLYTIIIVLTRL
jgi:hypothetical protein